MKVIIRVWRDDLPHEPLDGMPLETILEYDGFNEPEVQGHDIPIERCKYDTFHKQLEVYLDKMPARIDADPRWQTLHLLQAERLEFNPVAHTLLEADKGKGVILWTNPNLTIEGVTNGKD